MADKLKKLIIVVFLTLLIWAWAYLAQEEQSIESGTLSISPATSETLYVSFPGDTFSVPLEITFKGPTAKVAELQRRLHTEESEAASERLEFFYNVETEGNDTPGLHTLNILQFLRENQRINKMGLSVETVHPETTEVYVEKLEEKRLEVCCLDQNGTIIPHETIDPPKVRMYVFADRPAEDLRAYVDLTEPQIERARQSPIVATPYVRLGPGKRRHADIRVQVKLPPATEFLEDHVLQPRVGFIVPKNLMGRYSVELLNESDITSATNIKATPEAFAEYDRRVIHQVLVEVRASDEGIKGEITRDVIYNFPFDYVRKNEIMLAQPPRQAVFRLVPIDQRGRP